MALLVIVEIRVDGLGILMVVVSSLVNVEIGRDVEGIEVDVVAKVFVDVIGSEVISVIKSTVL